MGIGALVIPASSAHALGRPCAVGDFHVAIVVDFGTGASVTNTCIAAGSRDNGAQLLAARASVLGRAQPRFGSSGLLCAIDGFPATGCGQQSGGKFAYWAYYRASNGSWSYQSIGPAFIRVKADVVEGWRWHGSGAGNPTDPPPRGSANAAATCKPATPPPTTIARPAATTPAPIGTAGGGQTPTSRAGSGARGVPPLTNTTVAAVAGGVTTTIGTKDTASTTVKRGSTTTAADVSDGAVAAPIAATGGDEGGGAPIGLLVGGLLVAALAVGGVIAARRRARVT
jgi:hypothetical protein